MFATIHLIVGAAIGKYLPFWPVAFTLAFLSHFLLDTLPHTDPGTLKPPAERGTLNLTDLVFAGVDLFIAFFLLLWLSHSPTFSPSLLAGVIGGIAPDFAHGAFYALPMLKTTAPFSWYYRFHRKIQGTVDRQAWTKGLLIELIVGAGAVVLLLL